jgi:hypothetical protein
MRVRSENSDDSRCCVSYLVYVVLKGASYPLFILLVCDADVDQHTGSSGSDDSSGGDDSGGDDNEGSSSDEHTGSSGSDDSSGGDDNEGSSSDEAVSEDGSKSDEQEEDDVQAKLKAHIKSIAQALECRLHR